jgi:hypothetical protein
MARRFGRNQKRVMREMLASAEAKIAGNERAAKSRESALQAKLATVLRDQLAKGVIPLEVEHFLSADQRNVVMHAIFDERRANLHYQHQLSPKDLMIQRDAEQREAFGLYLGRAIADRIAEAYDGQREGTSRPLPTSPRNQEMGE